MPFLEDSTSVRAETGTLTTESLDGKEVPQTASARKSITSRAGQPRSSAGAIETGTSSNAALPAKGLKYGRSRPLKKASSTGKKTFPFAGGSSGFETASINRPLASLKTSPPTKKLFPCLTKRTSGGCVDGFQTGNHCCTSTLTLGHRSSHSSESANSFNADPSTRLEFSNVLWSEDSARGLPANA